MSAATHARRLYVQRISGDSTVLWWDAVVLTASSARQAQHYADQIQRRRQEGKLPGEIVYLVAPDVEDRRIGSGGATLNALRILSEHEGATEESWWRARRVLMIHSGGDSRRLPQYSLSGKFFGALPVKTPWGETSTVFDEFLALSTDWAARMEHGLLIASGDVLLSFDAGELCWNRPGICGVAMRQPVETGSQHGVYITDEQGRVYAFLQKPSAAQVRAAGGMLPDGKVALDTGLLRLDAPTATGLTNLACGIMNLPVIDLYEHVTMALTGQWAPGPEAHPALMRLAETLRGVAFSCSLVDGAFTHVGTTSHFRRLITEQTGFSELYEAQQRLGAITPAGLQSAGVVLDSVLAGGGEVGPGAVVMECDLDVPVRAGRGAILHGLSGLSAQVEVPADTVVHQVPVALADGTRGFVMRVYGVGDDAKSATWFGRPMSEVLDNLGLDLDAVWPGVDAGERTLWNAALFPIGPLEDAWDCARWLMRTAESYTAERWRQARRLSLAESAQWADWQTLAEGRRRRSQAGWRLTALSLAASGTDIRPLLAQAPGIVPLVSTGRTLAARAAELEDAVPTKAASRYYQASLFLAQAGLPEESEQARAAAFSAVRRAVDAGVYENEIAAGARQWQLDQVSVWAPPRIDFGGGWSDTPPFCLDWGGAVLNMAVELGGRYPICTRIRRIDEPLVRCVADSTAEFRAMEEILAPPLPGSPFSISRVALQMAGVARPGENLARTLARYGGGLEIRTEVDLPMGSGLGTSSILGATMLRALAEMLGSRPAAQALSDQVMVLEQRMTTGGGWQDQVGGIFPGAKLALSGPGLRQRVRVEPVGWSAERQQEFYERFLLYYTGFRRIAKDLLTQVVGSYLAREVGTVQVLHSIKTLALEMAYALGEGEWDYLGRLLDRHWQLNQELDPHTTNAPINALLAGIRPWLAGAKLAGAGGGGFLMLLAKNPEHAAELRTRLGPPGALYDFRIATDGLRVQTSPARQSESAAGSRVNARP